MVVEYSVAKFIVGSEQGLQITPVTRDEGQTNNEYRAKAHKLALAMRDQLGRTGVNGSVNVLSVDAISPEERAASQAWLIESGINPAELPTTRDIVAAVGPQELLGHIDPVVEN